MSSGTDAAERAVQGFRRRYRGDPAVVVRAPGRVNLIGDHTDYNDGLVLPMALPHAAVVAAAPRFDDDVSVESEGFGRRTFSAQADPGSVDGFGRYIAGMATVMRDHGIPVGGWDGFIASDIPAGAGLSSSAALEVATGLVFAHLAHLELGPTTLAQLGQRVENEILGLPSGIMDQLISAAARDGHAMCIDCRTLDLTPVRVPDDLAIVVIDSGTRRELADSAYAPRRRSCDEAAKLLGVHALRDAAVPAVERLDDDLLRRRARHVVREIARVREFARALSAGDLAAVGRLATESHESLRDDFEVSGPALDAVVDLAAATSGCFGARMTGGGFAGCAVAFVDAARLDSFCSALREGFVAPAGQPAAEPLALYAVRPSAGAGVVAAG